MIHGAFAASLRQDVRYTLRQMARTPGVTLAALVTTALAVGGTSAVYAVVHGVLLRPLPYPEPDRIVTVAEEHGGARTPFSGVLFTNLTYHAWRDSARTIEALGGHASRAATLTGLGDPQRLDGTAVTPSLFTVLRLRPAAGRLFVEEDAQEGAARVVVLAHEFWRTRFGGEPSAVGRSVTLDGERHEIVGVAPPGFQFPGPNSVDVYTVLHVAPRGQDPAAVNVLWGLARLRPGATVEQAAAEATAAARTVERPARTTLLFGEGGSVRVRVRRLHEATTARIRPALLVLAAGILFVLLIACANLANLFLARGASRDRELAIRAALGAGRARLMRQLLVESVVVSIAGGALGFLLGWALTTAVPAVAPADFPRVDGIRIDAAVAGMAFLVALFVGMAAGILPAIRGSASALASTMREGDGRATGGRGRRQRAALVAIEAALAVTLLVGALLLGRSFAALAGVDAGYRPDGVLIGTLHFTGGAGRPGHGPAVVEEILARLRTHPAVMAAGAGNMSPLDGVSAIAGFRIPGTAGTDGQPVTARALLYRITPGYAEALGMRLKSGRWFGAGDATSGTTPLLVNEAFARTYLEGTRPVVGRRFDGMLGFDAVEIVGVVRDLLHGPLDAPPEPQVYLPQRPDAAFDRMILAVRTEEPSAFVPALRSIVRETDPAVALGAVPLAERVGQAVSQPRFAAGVLAAFAVLAVLLSASGLYGVLSYDVSQRRRELGICAALGADRRRLMNMVLRQGLGVAAAGLGAGMLGAVAATRLLEGLLFGVSPLDPASFLAAPLVLGGVAIATCLVPALRAARADPVEALRTE